MPYLNSHGVFVTYDLQNKILISSDLFGAFSYHCKLFADDSYIKFSVKAMALLDEANTFKYGNPEITNVGVRNNAGILISGHDLTDLEQLL